MLQSMLSLDNIGGNNLQIIQYKLRYPKLAPDGGGHCGDKYLLQIQE